VVPLLGGTGLPLGGTGLPLGGTGMVVTGPRPPLLGGTGLPLGGTGLLTAMIVNVNKPLYKGKILNFKS
jgi:hypothetical protein